MLILLCTISVSVSPFQLARVLMYLVICLVENMVYTDTSMYHYIHVYSWDSIFIKIKRICSNMYKGTLYSFELQKECNKANVFNIDVMSFQLPIDVS